jgi:hypothetical protein
MAQLLRPKRFYAGKRESVVYIEADERGTTKTRKALAKGASEPLKRHPGCSEKA